MKVLVASLFELLYNAASHAGYITAARLLAIRVVGDMRSTKPAFFCVFYWRRRPRLEARGTPPSLARGRSRENGARGAQTVQDANVLELDSAGRFRAGIPAKTIVK